MELFIDILKDTTIDTVKLIPFLFLTYLAMEYLENKAGQKTVRMLLGAGKKGPVIGGILGVVPQCGFSAAASKSVFRRSHHSWNDDRCFSVYIR